MTDDQHSTITAADIGRIAHAMAQLYDLAIYRKALRERLLDAMMEMIPCDGPCSIFQMDDFYSNGGHMDTKRTVHRNLENVPLGQKMLLAWNKHVKQKDSPVERVLFQHSLKQSVGAGRLDDLIVRSEWQSTGEGKLAAKFDIGDMAYMWVKCSNTELWAVALRRYSREPMFTGRERQIMDAFGATLHEMRQHWYLEDLSRLTDTQQRVLLAREAYGDEDKVVAKKLGMNFNTYKTHLRDTRVRLGTKSMPETIALLRMRYLPDDMA